MSLHQQIKDQIKEAMKAREEVRLSVLRGLLAGFTNELVATKRPPTEELKDDEALAVIRRQVKQRKDSIDQFTKGGRPELAEAEKLELEILEIYLPQMMSREDVMKVAKAKMAELGIDPSNSLGAGKSGAGKFMGALMKEFKGQADGDTVKSVVDELLAN